MDVESCPTAHVLLRHSTWRGDGECVHCLLIMVFYEIRLVTLMVIMLKVDSVLWDLLLGYRDRGRGLLGT